MKCARSFFAIAALAAAVALGSVAASFATPQPSGIETAQIQKPDILSIASQPDAFVLQAIALPEHFTLARIVLPPRAKFPPYLYAASTLTIAAHHARPAVVLLRPS